MHRTWLVTDSHCKTKQNNKKTLAADEALRLWSWFQCQTNYWSYMGSSFHTQKITAVPGLAKSVAVHGIGVFPPLPCPKLLKVYVSISCLLKEDSPSQYSNFCGDVWEHVATLLRDLCIVYCNSRKDIVIHSARDSKRHGHTTWQAFDFWGTGTA